MDPVEALFPSIDDLPKAVHLGTIKRKVIRTKRLLKAASAKETNSEVEGKKAFIFL